jgi:hypothetical protein
MKQIWPTYAYSPTTNVLTLTGLNIDRDQLLLVTAADRGRIMYNFADSSVTASAFTAGANTALTLVATTAGLTTTAALVIYFDDQATSSTVTGTVELGPTSLNALESITVTMGQVTVTGGLTDVQLRASAVTVGGTVTVGNFPASQAVTFGAVTGSVSVLNFPASQAVTFSAVSISNFPATQPVSIASVTVGNTVTIAGTVTANPTGTQTIAGSVTLGAGTAQIGSVTASISGTVPVSGTFFQGTQPVSLTTLPALVAGTAQIGSVTASISNSVTIASFATSVTARLINPAGTSVTYAEVGTAGNPSIDVLSVQGVSGGTSLLIGGTTGSFTTRFGSVTTANTAQISTAVTNLSRKYLFVQNVTTSSNVITVGIGFTPTTTQGIQLAAGALIDFESSFIPTGAVYILSSVTGSPFTILEA